MDGVQMDTVKNKEDIDDRYYTTLRVTYNPNLSWIIPDCTKNTFLHTIIYDRVSETVSNAAQEELKYKTGHWKRGEFISSDGLILDTIEQTKMFMGKEHKNKKEMEKKMDICIYIITCARLDTRNRILIAPKSMTDDDSNVKTALRTIEKEVDHIKRRTSYWSPAT